MNFIEKILEDPRRFKKLKRASLASLAVIFLLEILVVNVLHLGHPHFGFEEFPGFGSLYGLISCVLIIVVSKLLGKLWLMRPEDYYD
ncbi:MAG: hypothetical protein V3U39_00770 [Acidimicrobiia bacterium]